MGFKLFFEEIKYWKKILGKHLEYALELSSGIP